LTSRSSRISLETSTRPNQRRAATARDSGPRAFVLSAEGKDRQGSAHTTTPHQTDSRPKNIDNDENKDSASNVERKDLLGNARDMTNPTSSVPQDVCPSRDTPNTRTVHLTRMRMRATRPRKTVTMNWKKSPPDNNPQTKEKRGKPAPLVHTKQPAQNNEQERKRNKRMITNETRQQQSLEERNPRMELYIVATYAD